MSNHRELAEHFLREAKTEPDASATVCALFAIAHALLAGPPNRCQSCGIEREVQHDEWCPMAYQNQEKP